MERKTRYALFYNVCGLLVWCRHARHEHATLAKASQCLDFYGPEFPAEIRHADGTPLTEEEERRIGKWERR